MEDATEKKIQPEDTPENADSPAAETGDAVTAEAETNAAQDEAEAVSPEKAADAPKKKKFAVKNKTLAALLVAGAVLLLAIIVVGGLSIHYESTFLPGTIINGYDCGGSSPEDAA